MPVVENKIKRCKSAQRRLGKGGRTENGPVVVCGERQSDQRGNRGERQETKSESKKGTILRECLAL